MCVNVGRAPSPAAFYFCSLQSSVFSPTTVHSPTMILAKLKQAAGSDLQLWLFPKLIQRQKQGARAPALNSLWDAGGVQRDFALDDHFEGGARFQAHVVAAAEESDGGADTAADSGPDQSSLDAVAQSADHCAGPGGSGYGFRFLSGLAILADGAFFIFHRGFFSSGDILDGSGQHHRITAGINESAEVHEDLGAPFDMSAAPDTADSALDIGAGGNHDAFVDYHRKGGDGINSVAFAGVLGGNGLFERKGHLGAGRDCKLSGLSGGGSGRDGR